MLYNHFHETMARLKEEVDEHAIVDVGFGVAKKLGLTQVSLDNILMTFNVFGYHVYGFQIPIATEDGKMTTIKLLCSPGIERSDINPEKVDAYSIA